ncbi:MAG: hypothetical protein IJI67_01485 [Clostridia bacterium]|nr:hypothetical protein [Clostridia bacterium]
MKILVRKIFGSVNAKPCEYHKGNAFFYKHSEFAFNDIIVKVFKVAALFGISYQVTFVIGKIIRCHIFGRGNDSICNVKLFGEFTIGVFKHFDNIIGIFVPINPKRNRLGKLGLSCVGNIKVIFQSLVLTGKVLNDRYAGSACFDSSTEAFIPSVKGEDCGGIWSLCIE